MTQPWLADKRWSDRFLPSLKRIIGEHLVDEAPPEEDAQRNTDLVVLKMAAVRVACRVRRATYAHHPFLDEFTIRQGRPNGVKTELTKIMEGWGDYLIYAFANEDETELAAWVLGDLKVFRMYLWRSLWPAGATRPGSEQGNPDGSSSFRAFRIDDLPADFVIARERLKVLA